MVGGGEVGCAIRYTGPGGDKGSSAAPKAPNAWLTTGDAALAARGPWLLIVAVVRAASTGGHEALVRMKGRWIGRAVLTGGDVTWLSWR